MDSKHTIGTLPNGLRYVYQNTPNSTSVAILVLVRYGAGMDRISGMAHLLEHLLFKGTQRRPKTKEIMAEFNSLGTQFNAYTTKHVTGYHTKSSYDHLEQNFDILTDMLIHTDFKRPDFPAEFEQEKKIVLEELNATKDNQMRSLSDLVEKTIFRDPLGYDANDDITSISRITLDDIISVYNTYYVASNIIISISGNLGSHSERIDSLINKYLGSLQSGTPNTMMFDRTFERPSIPFEKIVSKPTVQKAFLSMTYLDDGYRSRIQYFQTELVRLIFTDLTSGRLFQEMREKKGLLYSIHSSHICYDYIGYLTVRTSTDPKHIKNGSFFKEYDQQVSDFVSQGMTQKELELAKNNFSSTLLLQLEDSMTLAEYNAYELFYHPDDFLPYRQLIHLVRDFTRDEINACIRERFEKPRITIIIQPS